MTQYELDRSKVLMILDHERDETGAREFIVEMIGLDLYKNVEFASNVGIAGAYVTKDEDTAKIFFDRV